MEGLDPVLQESFLNNLNNKKFGKNLLNNSVSNAQQVEQKRPTTNFGYSKFDTGSNPDLLFNQGLVDRDRYDNQSAFSYLYRAPAAFLSQTSDMALKTVGGWGEGIKELTGGTPDFENNMLAQWGDNIVDAQRRYIGDIYVPDPTLQNFAGATQSFGAGLNTLTGLTASIVGNYGPSIALGALITYASGGTLTGLGLSVVQAANAARAASAVTGAIAGAYGEGYSEGRDLYKKTMQEKLESGMSLEDARKISQNSGEIVLHTNTLLNSALNLSIMGASSGKAAQKLFGSTLMAEAGLKGAEKGFGNVLRKTAKEAVEEVAETAASKGAQQVSGATLAKNAIQNINADKLASKHAWQDLAGKVATAGFEGIQEGIEEVNNMYASKLGEEYAKKNQKDYSLYDNFFKDLESYAKKVYNEEGAFNFVLGAIGGVGSKVVIDKFLGDGEFDLKERKALYKEMKSNAIDGLAKTELYRKSIDSLDKSDPAYQRKLQTLNDAFVKDVAIGGALKNGTHDIILKHFEGIQGVDNKQDLIAPEREKIQTYVSQKTQEIDEALAPLQQQVENFSPEAATPEQITQYQEALANIEQLESQKQEIAKQVEYFSSNEYIKDREKKIANYKALEKPTQENIEQGAVDPLYIEMIAEKLSEGKTLNETESAIQASAVNAEKIQEAVKELESQNEIKNLTRTLAELNKTRNELNRANNKVESELTQAQLYGLALDKNDNEYTSNAEKYIEEFNKYKDVYDSLYEDQYRKLASEAGRTALGFKIKPNRGAVQAAINNTFDTATALLEEHKSLKKYNNKALALFDRMRADEINQFDIDFGFMDAYSAKAFQTLEERAANLEQEIDSLLANNNRVFERFDTEGFFKYNIGEQGEIIPEKLSGAMSRKEIENISKSNKAISEKVQKEKERAEKAFQKSEKEQAKKKEEISKNEKEVETLKKQLEKLKEKDSEENSKAISEREAKIEEKLQRIGELNSELEGDENYKSSKQRLDELNDFLENDLANTEYSKDLEMIESDPANSFSDYSEMVNSMQETMDKLSDEIARTALYKDVTFPEGTRTQGDVSSSLQKKYDQLKSKLEETKKSYAESLSSQLQEELDSINGTFKGRGLSKKPAGEAIQSIKSNLNEKQLAQLKSIQDSLKKENIPQENASQHINQKVQELIDFIENNGGQEQREKIQATLDSIKKAQEVQSKIESQEQITNTEESDDYAKSEEELDLNNSPIILAEQLKSIEENINNLREELGNYKNNQQNLSDADIRTAYEKKKKYDDLVSKRESILNQIQSIVSDSDIASLDQKIGPGFKRFFDEDKEARDEFSKTIDPMGELSSTGIPQAYAGASKAAKVGMPDLVESLAKGYYRMGELANQLSSENIDKATLENYLNLMNNLKDDNLKELSSRNLAAYAITNTLHMSMAKVFGFEIIKPKEAPKKESKAEKKEKSKKEKADSFDALSAKMFMEEYPVMAQKIFDIRTSFFRDFYNAKNALTDEKEKSKYFPRTHAEASKMKVASGMADLEGNVVLIPYLATTYGKKQQVYTDALVFFPSNAMKELHPELKNGAAFMIKKSQYSDEETLVKVNIKYMGHQQKFAKKGTNINHNFRIISSEKDFHDLAGAFAGSVMSKEAELYSMDTIRMDATKELFSLINDFESSIQTDKDEKQEQEFNNKLKTFVNKYLESYELTVKKITDMFNQQMIDEKERDKAIKYIRSIYSINDNLKSSPAYEGGQGRGFYSITALNTAIKLFQDGLATREEISNGFNIGLSENVYGEGSGVFVLDYRNIKVPVTKTYESYLDIPYSAERVESFEQKSVPFSITINEVGERIIRVFNNEHSFYLNWDTGVPQKISLSLGAGKSFSIYNATDGSLIFSNEIGEKYNNSAYKNDEEIKKIVEKLKSGNISKLDAILEISKELSNRDALPENILAKQGENNLTSLFLDVISRPGERKLMTINDLKKLKEVMKSNNNHGNALVIEKLIDKISFNIELLNKDLGEKPPYIIEFSLNPPSEPGVRNSGFVKRMFSGNEEFMNGSVSIAFDPSMLADPSSLFSQNIIAHELAHVAIYTGDTVQKKALEQRDKAFLQPIMIGSESSNIDLNTLENNAGLNMFSDFMKSISAKIDEDGNISVNIENIFDFSPKIINYVIGMASISNPQVPLDSSRLSRRTPKSFNIRFVSQEGATEYNIRLAKGGDSDEEIRERNLSATVPSYGYAMNLMEDAKSDLNPGEGESSKMFEVYREDPTMKVVIEYSDKHTNNTVIPHALDLEYGFQEFIVEALTNPRLFSYIVEGRNYANDNTEYGKSKYSLYNNFKEYVENTLGMSESDIKSLGMFIQTKTPVENQSSDEKAKQIVRLTNKKIALEKAIADGSIKLRKKVKDGVEQIYYINENGDEVYNNKIVYKNENGQEITRFKPNADTESYYLDIPDNYEFFTEEEKKEKKLSFSHNNISIPLQFELGQQQEEALMSMVDFINNKNEKEFVLEGAAGTGKSSIVGLLTEYLKAANDNRTVKFSTTTHASRVPLFKFIKKIDPNAAFPSTIDSIINPLSKSNYATPDFDLLIVDEASMLRDDLYEKIQSVISKPGKNVKVIYLGDPKQITQVETNDSSESVKVSKPFSRVKNKSILNKIYRQNVNHSLKIISAVRNRTSFNGMRLVDANGVVVNDLEEANKLLDDSVVLYKNIDSAIENIDTIEKAEKSIFIAYTNKRVKELSSAIRNIVYGEKNANENILNTGEKIVGGGAYGSADLFLNGIFMKYTGSPVSNENSVDGVFLLSDSNDTGGANITPLESEVKINPSYGKIYYAPMFDDDTLSSGVSKDDVSKNIERFVDAAKLAKTSISGMQTNDDVKESVFLDSLKKNLSKLVSNSLSNRVYWGDAFSLEIDHKGSVTIKKASSGNGYIKFSDGTKMPISKGLDYGYAMTAHKSQGSTVENVYVDTENISSARGDKKVLAGSETINSTKNALMYTALSRVSGTLHLPFGAFKSNSEFPTDVPLKAQRMNWNYDETAEQEIQASRKDGNKPPKQNQPPNSGKGQPAPKGSNNPKPGPEESPSSTYEADEARQHTRFFPLFLGNENNKRGVVSDIISKLSEAEGNPHEELINSLKNMRSNLVLYKTDKEISNLNIATGGLFSLFNTMISDEPVIDEEGVKKYKVTIPYYSHRASTPENAFVEQERKRFMSFVNNNLLTGKITDLSEIKTYAVKANTNIQNLESTDAGYNEALKYMKEKFGENKNSSSGDYIVFIYKDEKFLVPLTDEKSQNNKFPIVNGEVSFELKTTSHTSDGVQKYLSEINGVTSDDIQVSDKIVTEKITNANNAVLNERKNSLGAYVLINNHPVKVYSVSDDQYVERFKSLLTNKIDEVKSNEKMNDVQKEDAIYKLIKEHYYFPYDDGEFESSGTKAQGEYSYGIHSSNIGEAAGYVALSMIKKENIPTNVKHSGEMVVIGKMLSGNDSISTPEIEKLLGLLKNKMINITESNKKLLFESNLIKTTYAPVEYEGEIYSTPNFYMNFAQKQALDLKSKYEEVDPNIGFEERKDVVVKKESETLSKRKKIFKKEDFSSENSTVDFNRYQKEDIQRQVKKNKC